MAQEKLKMVALGDIILGDDSEYYVNSIRPMLERFDVRIGQLEVPYTLRNEVLDGLSREPERLNPLKGVMDIMTMSGNHLYDAKDVGVEDSIAKLDELGILHTGAGMNLAEARKPAVFTKNGTRIGVLNYNCVGASANKASDKKPGGAYVDIYTRYELGDVANPGGAAEKIYTYPDPVSMDAMLDDIHALRENCDVLCVYFHKGIVHMPVKLADYERFVCHAAIDAGADVIFASHSHILHGIEVYRGRTIYHGLCNGIAWVPSLSPKYIFKNAKKNDVFDPEEWTRNRIARFGFVPDEAYPTYPFHPEAIYTVFATCKVEDGKIVKTGFIPAIVGTDGAPRVCGRNDGGEEVLAYMKKITEKAGLPAQFAWDGDEVAVLKG
ncbi:MAG: CapA family protein [Eubacterium sp.]|nr:CapA family protein [Eubacterium sp.]